MKVLKGLAFAVTLLAGSLLPVAEVDAQQGMPGNYPSANQQNYALTMQYYQQLQMMRQADALKKQQDLQVMSGTANIRPKAIAGYPMALLGSQLQSGTANIRPKPDLGLARISNCSPTRPIDKVKLGAEQDWQTAELWAWYTQLQMPAWQLQYTNPLPPGLPASKMLLPLTWPLPGTAATPPATKINLPSLRMAVPGKLPTAVTATAKPTLRGGQLPVFTEQSTSPTPSWKSKPSLRPVSEQAATPTSGSIVAQSAEAYLSKPPRLAYSLVWEGLAGQHALRKWVQGQPPSAPPPAHEMEQPSLRVLSAAVVQLPAAPVTQPQPSGQPGVPLSAAMVPGQRQNIDLMPASLPAAAPASTAVPPAPPVLPQAGLPSNRIMDLGPG
jgi:hypothetical protein